MQPTITHAFNYQHGLVPVPKMRGRLILELPEFNVRLFQSGATFGVGYGLQVKEGLTYTEACAEFGQCVFHAHAAEGRLDNPKS